MVLTTDALFILDILKFIECKNNILKVSYDELSDEDNEVERYLDCDKIEWIETKVP